MAKREKHTPGPWEAAERGAYGDFDGNSRVILGDDTRIAVVQHHGQDWAEANALLIAAAPELLEALETALPFLEGFDDADIYEEDEEPVVAPIIKQARAALAKATPSPTTTTRG